MNNNSYNKPYKLSLPDNPLNIHDQKLQASVILQSLKDKADKIFETPQHELELTFGGQTIILTRAMTQSLLALRSVVMSLLILNVNHEKIVARINEQLNNDFSNPNTDIKGDIESID